MKTMFQATTVNVTLRDSAGQTSSFSKILLNDLHHKTSSTSKTMSSLNCKSNSSMVDPVDRDFVLVPPGALVHHERYTECNRPRLMPRPLSRTAKDHFKEAFANHDLDGLPRGKSTFLPIRDSLLSPESFDHDSASRVPMPTVTDAKVIESEAHLLDVDVHARSRDSCERVRGVGSLPVLRMRRDNRSNPFHSQSSLFITSRESDSSSQPRTAAQGQHLTSLLPSRQGDYFHNEAYPMATESPFDRPSHLDMHACCDREIQPPCPSTPASIDPESTNRGIFLPSL